MRSNSSPLHPALTRTRSPFALGRTLSLGLLPLGALLLPFAAFAQAGSSSLSGTVTDPTGAVVPNARVIAHENSTGQDHVVTTNSSGAYTITNLSSGLYTVRVEAQGFTTVTQQNTRLDPAIGARFDAALKTGESSTNVTVQADANTLQTETSSVGQLVTSEQVHSAQLNGRNPIYLSQLEPGVTRNAPLSSFGFSPDFTGPSVSGARPNESLLTLDGAPQVRTRANGTSVGVADVDTISQVQILSTDYPAQYGQTSGGLIAQNPRSGTSDFHGAAYEYLRNSFFDANTWIRKDDPTQPSIADHPPAFRYNQFGWNVGGPFYIPGKWNKNKSKLFFEIGQEFLRYRQEATQTGTVPTPLMRQGNFSELLAPNIFYGGTNSNGTPIQKVIVNPITHAPYPNNVITAGLSPNGLGLLNEYPLPNVSSPSFNWEGAAPYPQNQRKDTLIIDYLPAPAHHLRFSVLNYNYNQVSPFSSNFLQLPEVWNWPNQVGILHYIWTINPTTVNDVTFSASADHVTITNDLSSGLANRSNYGINFPYLFPAAQKENPNKIPTVEIANFTTDSGEPYPSHSGGVITNLADNLTKVLGNHTLVVGGLWRRDGENDFDQISVYDTVPGATNNQNGQFIFTDTRTGAFPTTGAAVANAALGLFDTYGEIGQKSYTLFRGNLGEVFAQDTWRATPKTVIEYGVRYSVSQPFYALWRNQSVFDPARYNPATAPTVNPTTGYASGGNAYDGVVIPGTGFPSSAQGHLPASILNGQYQSLFSGSSHYSNIPLTDVQPRIGITYQLAPTTVVRAGGGRFVQRLGISDEVETGGNAPFQTSETVSGGGADNPGGVGVNQLPLSLSSQAKNFPSPEAWSWNLSVEQDIPRFATLNLGYVGRRGLHLSELDQINQPQPGATFANPGVQPDALRPYQGFSTILQDTDAGRSIYNSLQVNLKRRLTNNVLFAVAYTWSKSLDYGSSDGYELPNVYDRSINYGPSDFDIRNVLVVNYLWQIPFANHATNRLVRGTLGNWQLAGITQVQSGEPVTGISDGSDYAGVGPGSGTQLYVMTHQPHMAKQFSSNSSAGTYWFDPKAFAPPAEGTFAGRGTRNEVYGPGFQSWNASLQKDIHIIPKYENQLLTFKAEAFDFTNHPNLDSLNQNGNSVNPTSNTFGQITTKGQTYESDREWQFSLRYAF
jgi:hypothetical protein